jgi:tRNA dimethylallyltransferase
MAVVIFLVGPTAIGKTSIALQIAKKLAVEIVSADSRQIYQFLTIGTAKPSAEELLTVPHHFIDLLEPDKPYSAGKFGRDARLVIHQILKRKKVPLVVGGAGFYIKALIDGLSEVEIDTTSVREELRRRWKQGESELLYAELNAVDPQMAESLEKNDKQRVLRALEVYLVSRRRLSEMQKTEAKPAEFKPLMFGLTAERKFLYEKINSRVDNMFARGLIAEVKVLIRRGYNRELNALNTVGYKEVFDYLEHKMSYEEMVSEIKTNSRRYAKRQLTWFRSDERIHWIDVGKIKSIQQVADRIIEKYRQMN